MSILTMTATKLAYANPATGSKWIEGAAMQGTYGSSGAPRAGAMLFSTLRPVDWSAQSISRIRLALSFSGAGYNREKTIGLYGGARSALSGTGTSMLGAAIGSVPTGASAYNGDAKIVFSPSVNAAAFENFVDFLRSGTQNALAVYVSETTNQSHSTNYLQITAASVEVTYEPAGSAGALDRTSVAVGETISLTIVPSAEDAVHKVRWTLGELSQTQQLAAGEVLASLTVPSNWLAAFPSAPSARASCTLETWRGGVCTASRGFSFTVVPGEDDVPDFILTAAPAGAATQGYYQHISAATISISAAVSPGGGYGVGVGCFVADATQDSPRFEVDYPSRFNKSAHVAGVASFGDAANFNDEANFYASASFGGMSFFHQPTYFFDDIQVSGKATFNGGTEGVCSMISDGEEIAFGAVPSQSTQTYECAAIETYGLYLFIANVSFATNTAGRRMVELYRNTTTWLAGQTAAPNTSYTRMTATAVAMFGVGDVPRVCMYQNSGSELKAYVRVWLVRLG